MAITYNGTAITAVQYNGTTYRHIVCARNDPIYHYYRVLFSTGRVCGRGYYRRAWNFCGYDYKRSGQNYQARAKFCINGGMLADVMPSLYWKDCDGCLENPGIPLAQCAMMYFWYQGHCAVSVGKGYCGVNYTFTSTEGSQAGLMLNDIFPSCPQCGYLILSGNDQCKQFDYNGASMNCCMIYTDWVNIAYCDYVSGLTSESNNLYNGYYLVDYICVSAHMPNTICTCCVSVRSRWPNTVVYTLC